MPTTPVIDVGRGPVVLFVHGLSSGWKNWLERPRLNADVRRFLEQ